MKKKEKTIINREISWLSFNERVLQEAADEQVPLIERIHFLGIFSNNRDEFFKVRVATIKRMLEFENQATNIIGEDPIKLVNQIQRIIIDQQVEFNKILDRILRSLCEKNLHLINEKQLKPPHQEFIRNYFINYVQSEISPVLLSHTGRLPSLKDRYIYLAVKLMYKNDPYNFDYAMIEVPSVDMGRFVELPPVDGHKYLIMLDDIIRYNLDKIFAIFDYDHYEAHTIKFTRDAEMDIDNDISKSLWEKIYSGVAERQKGQPVRFIYDRQIPTDLLDYLIDQMQLDNYDHIIQGARYHNSKDYMDFPSLGDTSLEYPKTPSLDHPLLKGQEDMLAVMEKDDFLLQTPYQKFSEFTRMLRQAAIDPAVKEIKITIYRVAKHSKVINALINAAQNGKEVTAVFELRARFDEESNVYWSKKLEEAGARVVLGFPDLKVHAKLCLIKRDIGEGPKDLAVIGTGNFHEVNAKVFSDSFLFTSNPDITHEVRATFDLFQNSLKIPKYKHLLVSPLQLRSRLEGLIEAEIKNARRNKEAYIVLKVNNLVDKSLINKLYKASNAGVKISLLVRSTCSLIPKVKGMSENIHAISIVDKFLEHTRCFIFGNGGDELIYLSSSDWMVRNLDTRVEVTVPVYDQKVKKEIRNLINIQLKDNVKARLINKQQNNPYKSRGNNKKSIRSQEELYNYYARMVDVPELSFSR